MSPGVAAAELAGLGLAASWLANTLGAYAVTKMARLLVVRRTCSADAIALTFDDGPDPRWTPRVCDRLEAAGSRGTFFLLAEKAAAQPDLVRELLERGHEVALHGQSHRPLWLRWPWSVRRDMERGLACLEDLVEGPVEWCRPPWGHCTLDSLWTARRLGLRTALWSVCPEGFVGRHDAEALAAATASARAGDIVCLHDAGGRPDTPRRVLAALDLALPRLEERGLVSRPLSEHPLRAPRGSRSAPHTHAC